MSRWLLGLGRLHSSPTIFFSPFTVKLFSKLVRSVRVKKIHTQPATERVEVKGAETGKELLLTYCMCVVQKVNSTIEWINTSTSKTNTPFPSCCMPQFQSESRCTTIQMEMSCVFLRKIKLISLTTIEHQDSLQNRDKQQLGNGPLSYPVDSAIHPSNNWGLD